MPALALHHSLILSLPREVLSVEKLLLILNFILNLDELRLSGDQVDLELTDGHVESEEALLLSL